MKITLKQKKAIMDLVSNGKRTKAISMIQKMNTKFKFDDAKSCLSTIIQRARMAKARK